MSKYQFTNIERHAVFTVHGEKCYMCGNPIDLMSMHVDHIIPEKLLDDLPELNKILKSFGLPKDFELNSPANWLPSCASCNMKKGGRIFSPTPLIQLTLENAIKKSKQVEELQQKTVSTSQVSRALNTLERAFEEGNLDIEQIKPSLERIVKFHVEVRPHEIKLQPFYITSSLGYKIIDDKGTFLLIEGPYGVGLQPKGQNIHPSWQCPTCGMSGWNGARCIFCGQMNDE